LQKLLGGYFYLLTLYMSQIVKNAVSYSVEESFRKFLDLHPDVDDLTKFNGLFFVPRYVFVKIFVKIQAVVLHEAPDRLADINAR